MAKKIDILAISGPFRWVRKYQLKISRRRLAAILNVTWRDMTRFENGKALLPRDAMDLIINAGLESIVHAHDNPDKLGTDLPGTE